MRSIHQSPQPESSFYHLHHHRFTWTRFLPKNTRSPLPTLTVSQQLPSYQNQYLIHVHAAAMTADGHTETETLAYLKPILAHDLCGIAVETPSLFSSIITSNFRINNKVTALKSFSRDEAATEYVTTKSKPTNSKTVRLNGYQGCYYISILSYSLASSLHARVY